MGKFIFWLVVAFVVLFGLRLMSAGKARRRARERDDGASPAARAGETMVRCSSCGVFLPKGDARPVAGGYVCGEPGCGVRR
jgi:hypothetical protein